MLGLIPIEAGIGILLYIGIVIVAQSFQETPKEHAPAVALGIVPALFTVWIRTKVKEPEIWLKSRSEKKITKKSSFLEIFQGALLKR